MGRGQIVERLEIEELERRAEELDRAVDATPGADPFCSRSAWTLSFHRAFGSGRPLCSYAHGGSFVALARAHHAWGAYLEPLEGMWGLACPLLGPGAVELLARMVHAPGSGARGLPLLLMGLPAGGAIGFELGRALSREFDAVGVEATQRCVASLEGGLDGFLGRRSPAFRRNLRAAARRLARAGICFERLRPKPAEVPALYERVLAIERRSWKAAAGNGADSPAMAAFYRAMWPRLARSGALCVLIARSARGEDVGYLHGGRVGAHFRGLQFSFDAQLRSLSLGNALQLEVIGWLCEEGCELYDLGTRAPYKERWAERIERADALLLRPC